MLLFLLRSTNNGIYIYIYIFFLESIRLSPGGSPTGYIYLPKAICMHGRLCLTGLRDTGIYIMPLVCQANVYNATGSRFLGEKE